MMPEQSHSLIVFNPYAIPFLFASLAMIFLGGYVFARSGKRPERFSFLVLCFAFCIWLFSTFLAYSSLHEPFVLLSVCITYLGVAIINPALFWYASSWLGFEKSHRRLIAGGFVLAAIFWLVIILTDWILVGIRRFFWGYHSQLTPIGGALFLIFFLSYLALFLHTLYKAYRRTDDPVRKKQIRLVGVAFLIANLGSSDFLPCYGIEVFPVGGLLSFAAFVTLSYTIVRYRLLDIETVLHKTAMWFLTTVIAVAPFALLIHLTLPWTKTIALPFATVYFLVTLLVFYFYFNKLQPLLARLFRKQSANLDKVLSQFSKELVHLKSIRELLQKTGRTLRSRLYAKKISILLLDEASQAYVPVLAKSVRGIQPISRNHPFIQWLEKRDEVSVANLVEEDPEVQVFKEEVVSYFSSLEAHVVLPLLLSGKLIGLIHLGKKENLKRYTPAEVQFLTQLKVPVTIAFSNSMQFENVSKLYNQVQNQNERLKELDRLKTEFLANTSHELRTPLNGILGLVEAILDGADGPLNDPQKRHLQMIIESGANLKELINNLLELSRLESGQQTLAVKSFNIMNVVDSVISLLEGVARKKGISLSRSGSARIPDVYGDPEKIQRVLMNLVGNAVKFTQQGKVNVIISDLESLIEITVEDSGIGISEEDQKLIFERFRQADGSMTRQFEGTGLGLSIAREIVRLHQSDIEVESEPGRGSRFSFRLPKNKEILSGQSRPAATPLKQPNESRSYQPAVERRKQEVTLSDDPEFKEAVHGHGEKVLIIDDNEINREVVKTQLEIHGYTVAQAADGIEGMEKTKTQNPELIILDLMMPRMSGYEFCKKMRKNHSADALPIIMLTAKTDMGDKVYGLNLGANDYIAKPFNKDELIARVSILMKIRRMTQELKKWNAELEQRVDDRTRELVKTQEQLIQAEKLATIGTLAGGVAHEINNPLTAVLTNAQILKMDANEDDAETLALIEEGAKRCQIIVQKLLKYSRRPDQERSMEKLRLIQVIRNTISMLSYQLHQENIELLIEEHGEGTIQGISNELEQVFTNLILNARDAIREAGRKGVIRIEFQDKPKMVEVRVSDNGAGIKKENLNRIFDPFFTTKEVGQGTGLGLAVTQNILQKHQCKTSIQSEEGKGTTFILQFPSLEEKVAQS